MWEMTPHIVYGGGLRGGSGLIGEGFYRFSEVLTISKATKAEVDRNIGLFQTIHKFTGG